MWSVAIYFRCFIFFSSFLLFASRWMQNYLTVVLLCVSVGCFSGLIGIWMKRKRRKTHKIWSKIMKEKKKTCCENKKVIIEIFNLFFVENRLKECVWLISLCFAMVAGMSIPANGKRYWRCKILNYNQFVGHIVYESKNSIKILTVRYCNRGIYWWFFSLGFGKK